MNVHGMLEVAQLENLSADPTLLPTGRVWANVASPSSAIPKFFDGTNVRQLLMAPVGSSGFVSQNSGNACTVNWASGLYQQVVLTGHATISFSNPQSGQEHILMIQQAALENAGVYKTGWQYKLNMIDQDSRRQSYQPISVLQTSESAYYRWFYSPGIKAAYANLSVPSIQPSTLPSATTLGIDISPDGKYICSGNSSSPFTSVYAVYDAGAYLKYGNKNQTTPTTAAGTIWGVAYTPDNDIVFLAGPTTPFLQGFYNNLVGGPGVVLANPGTLPPSAATCVAVHPSGKAVIVGCTTTPFMAAYPLTSGAYGTKYSNPATIPPAEVTAFAFSQTGDYVAASSTSSPFIQVWPFDPITGFGTVVSNPGTLPNGFAAGAGKGIAWRPQGDYIAMASSSSSDTFLYVVNFSRSTGTFGAVVSASLSGLTGVSNCVQWTPDGQYLIVGNANTPFVFVYSFANGTIGPAITIDGSNTAGSQVNDIAIHPSGEYAILTTSSSPFIKTFALPRPIRNYMRLTNN